MNYPSLHVRVFLLLLVLAVILFAPFFLQGKVFIAADTLYLSYPWKHYAPQNYRPHNILITDPVNSSYAEVYNKQLKEWRLSGWSPAVLTGTSGIIGSAGPYFPLRMALHYFFSTPVATTLFMFIHVVLMGVFMYYYLQEIDAGWHGALFGAVAYMFNGCVMVWLEFDLWVTASAYLPLLLLFMERFRGEHRYRYACAAGIAYGLMVLNTSFQLALYVSILMPFYILFILLRSSGGIEDRREISAVLICFVIAVLLGMGIGAVEILPFIEKTANSSRMGRTFDFYQLFDTLARVPFRYFVTLIFPDFFGSPPLYANLIPRLPSQEYMNYNELALYAGIPTVFAVCACVISWKDRFTRYYLFMTLLVIALITGTYAYYPFFKLVPGMDKMNPTRLIFLFVFAFSVVSAQGIKGLISMTPGRRAVFLMVSVLVLSGVAYLSFFGNGPGISRWFNQEHFAALPPDQTNSLVDLLHRFRSISSPIIYKPLLLTIAAFCLFSLFAFARTETMRNTVFLFLVALLSYDLISFGRNYNTTVFPEIVYSKKPSIEFLLKQSGPFRVVQDVDAGLGVNTLVPFGLEEVGGYQNVYTDRVNKLMSYIKFGEQAFRGNVFDRWVTFGSRSMDISSRFFDLMNVRYVLTAPDTALSHKKFKRVFNEDLAIYENMQVLPRAYVVHTYAVLRDLSQALKYMGTPAFDMRTQVVLEKGPSPDFVVGTNAPPVPPKAVVDAYSPDEIAITAELSANGWLVVSDAYYPGWTADVDGKKTEIRLANGIFRAVELQKGKHAVSFKYHPFLFRAGLTITILGFAVATLGICWKGKTKLPTRISRLT